MALKLQDFIDMEQFQRLQDHLNKIYAFPSAIIDLEGRILTATGWQDICTKFHRLNLECEKECIKSDQYISSHLHEANPAVSYRCPHGLVDNATPIIIGGVHYGTFFTGQFFMEEPDLEFFRIQAAKYGFDEHAYLEAVKKVPIWNGKQLNDYLFFIKGLIEVISEIGSKNLSNIESQKKIQESEERYRTILQTAMVGFWLTDLQGKLVEVNDAYCQMSGYSEQELLNMSVSDLEIEEVANDTAIHIQKVLAQGQDSFVTRHRRKDGRVLNVDIYVQYRAREGGQFVVFLRDTTERRLAEVALAESQAYLDAIINNTTDMIWTVDPELFGLRSYNSALYEYYLSEHGIHIELGMTPKDLFRTDAYVQAWHGFYQRALEEGPYTVEYAVYTGNRVLELSFNCLKRSGEVFGLSVFGKDITERKRAEDKRKALEAQLQHSQKMESVGRLAGGVAHDFNNLLTVILGYSELGMDELDSAHPVHLSLQQIYDAAQRSADLTKQLLAFARKQTVVPKVLDLNEAVENILKMLRRLIGEDIHLAWQPANNLWKVKIDPSQIDQILANLCVNARDAIAGGGKITIETENSTFDEHYCSSNFGFVPGDYVQLAVSDNGCGMDQETMKNIFEPFFTTKRLGEGTGLGLATVYGIVKQNKGFINTYSELGQGTTFKIYLPRHQGKAGQPRIEGAAKPLARGHETVLLVEDDLNIVKMTTVLLERQGYKVFASNTPREAIELAIKHATEIQLLITDVVMPEMNGRDLAESLVLHCPKLKCLFMSGYTANIIAEHGVLDEGVHFIHKPFSLSELATKVREVLDGERT